MSKPKDPAPTILIYPDAQKILEKAPNLLTAIAQYQEEIRFIKVNINRYNFSLDQVDLAVSLYDKFIGLMKQYYDAYEDIRFRESFDKTDVFATFFKGLSNPMSTMHPNISFTYYSRLKSFYRFLEKALTLLEFSMQTGDTRKLDRYYDIHAIKFVTHTGRATQEKDYPGAIDDCYTMFNDFITYILDKGGDLMVPVSVGPSSSKVKQPYRDKVKDYIANAKPNGYMALHASFSMPIKGKKRFFEVQVESQWMFHNSEDGGSSGHDTYKENSKLHILDLNPERICIPGFLYPADEIGLFQRKDLTKPKTYWAKV